MDLRMQLVTEYMKGDESVAALSRRFDISRKTVYKWIRRYEEDGPAGLEERSRAPLSNSRSPADEAVALILSARNQHPTWGSRKLHAWLAGRYPTTTLPAASTIGSILKRYGLIAPRKRRRRTPLCEHPFGSCDHPNAVWYTDFKGHFKMGNGRRCHPLTTTDGYSRFILGIRAFSGPTGEKCRRSFERLFREYGLPDAIRTDNGTPFASRGAGGLSRLAVWWVKLGITPERIYPGKPQQNGRHERMHRTLKAETTKPARPNLRAQQQAFDRFRHMYNTERPHETLDFATPSNLYTPSLRPMTDHTPRMEYDSGLQLKKVISNGRIRWRGDLVFINSALTGEYIRFEEELIRREPPPLRTPRR